MAVLSSFFEMFLVLGMYNFEQNPNIFMELSKNPLVIYLDYIQAMWKEIMVVQSYDGATEESKWSCLVNWNSDQKLIRRRNQEYFCCHLQIVIALEYCLLK